MFGLLRKSSVFYITHIFTFSLIGWSAIFEEKYGVFIVMSSLVPVWMSSSVLWAERMEQYRFLKILPITSREVVNLKLSLIAMAGLLYFSLLTFIILLAGETGGYLPINIATIVLACAVGVLLAVIWQICIWRFGLSIMTPIILVSGAVLLLVVIVSLATLGRKPSLIGVNNISVFRLLAQPLFFIPALAMTGLTFYGLWLLAIRVFELSDPD
jgi:hypothetical protein